MATSAAMIPLVELADPRVSRIYGVAPDAETIGILTSAANQKGVRTVNLICSIDRLFLALNCVGSDRSNAMVMIAGDLNGWMQVEVVAKVYWGEPAKKLTEAAQGIPLHWLVVGNRGLGAVKRQAHPCISISLSVWWCLFLLKRR
jgi:hypothetical protein